MSHPPARPSWFRRHESLLSLTWLGSVLLLSVAWGIFCLTPDGGIGIYPAIKWLRVDLIEQREEAQRLARQGAVKEALVLLGQLEKRTRGRSTRNALGRFRARVLTDLGELHRRQGNIDEAIAVLAEAATCDPNNDVVLLAQGRALAAAGKKEAGETLQAAMAIHPYSEEVTVALARWYASRGQYTNAAQVVKTYQTAVRPVAGVARRGAWAQPFSFLGDGEQHHVRIPCSGIETASGPLILEVNDAATELRVVRVQGARRFGGDRAQVIVPPPFTATRKPEPNDPTLIDETVFEPPTYLIEVPWPGVRGSPSQIELVVSSSRRVPPELNEVLEATRAGGK